jgi:hypothetical protein
MLLKKQNELNLVDRSRDLSHKRHTLRNSLALLWPKQMAAAVRLWEVKQNTGKNFYDGLLVNIFGDIKIMLGPV